VIALPATVASEVWHERTARPLRCRVQARHMPTPQPYLVPVSLRRSRTTQSNGVSGAASTVVGLPLTLNVIAILHSARVTN
jgi:hypothetical protein